MSSLESLAESMSGVATFVTSAIGSGLITIALVYPSSCTGEIPFQECTNVLGMSAMTQQAATPVATIVGLAIGGLALLIRSSALSNVEQRRAAEEAAALKKLHNPDAQ